MVDLLSILLGACCLVGNFKVKGNGIKWAAKEELHDYPMFVKIRTCPASGDWPELTDCLASDYACRAAWLQHLRAGKTLTEAIRLTVSERAGNWSWTVPNVASQYASLQKSRSLTVQTGPPEVSYPDTEDEHPGRRKLQDARMRSRTPRPPVAPANAAPRTRQGGGSSANKGQGRGKRRSASGGGHVSRSGIPFCQPFGKGKCVEGRICPNGHVHACDWVDPVTGHVCGRQGARRKDHGVTH